MIECFIVVFVCIVCWFAFFWKINYVRGLENDGLQNPQRRKIGDVPPIYPNGWFSLLESSQLKNGQVKHVAALGENFAVFRTKEGIVNIVDAYCPHLGANMAVGGKVLDDGCLQCPFHHWSFSGDGQCQNIPYAKSMLKTVKIKSWKCYEANQFIFVWYHADSAEPEWYIEQLPQISSKEWRCHGRNEFLVNSHIQEIPENGADWAHLNAVHGSGIIASQIFPSLSHHLWTGAVWTPRSSMNQSGDPRYEDINNELSINSNKTNNDNPFKNDKHRAIVQIQHDLIISETYPILHLNITAEQIGPGYVELHIESAFGPMCIVQTVTPIQPLVQCVKHVIFSSFIISPCARVVFLGESIMFERDIAVWNHKKFQKNPILVQEDRRILAYRRWYSQFYSPSSPKYINQIESLEW